ncbi:MAG: hypothetical protein ACREFQ_16860 [Stellaceae bacterium]
MSSTCSFTRHAWQRMQQRSIPSGVVDLILEYGHEAEAGEGASRFALDKDSLRAIRRSFGTQFADALNRYRSAYVVANGERVITAAFASRPIF